MSTSTAPSNLPEKVDAKEVAAITADIGRQAAKLISAHFKRQVKRTVSVGIAKRLKNGLRPPADDLGIGAAYKSMFGRMLTNPMKIAQAQMAMAQEFVALWQYSMRRAAGMPSLPVARPGKSDKRFGDPDWENNFVFDFIKQSYLISSRHIIDGVRDVDGLDEISRKKVEFFTRQLLDALAPTNFVMSNPVVLRETIRTNGKNLLKGLSNLLRDIDESTGQLRVRMTDASVFKLGENVASTPGKVVFENEMFQLIQFMPTTAKQFKRPLLILPPWINKYYILDLRASNSFIKWATDQGHTVFVVSWVNPDAKLAEKGFDAYMSEGSLTAIDAVCKQTGVEEINVIGYCLGGTLLGSTLAYMAAKNDHRVASATFFVALLDFSVPGELGVFIDEGQVASLEKKMAEKGFLEGSAMAGTFNMLRSNDLIWTFFVNNYLMGKEPAPFDLLFWNSDATRMPYKMHSFYLRNMYLNNLLRVPGGITLLDTPIDLKKVKAPAYFISTAEDHIAPWKGTYLGSGALGGPVRFVLGGSGHIAGIVNPPSANKYCYWTNDVKKNPAKPDDWYAGATQHEGSWWNDWQTWISGLDSTMVAARNPLKGKLKVLDDAPGSFVKFRLDAQPNS